MALLGSILLNHEIEAKIYQGHDMYTIIFYRHGVAGKVSKIKSENITDLTEYLLNTFGWMKFQLSDENKGEFNLIWHDPDV